jgi:hypothetical protein
VRPQNAILAFFESLSNGRRLKLRVLPPKIISDGVSHRDPTGVAQGFATYFQNISSPSVDSSLDRDRIFYLETEAKYINIKAASTNHISDTFEKLNRRKAPGVDML